MARVAAICIITGLYHNLGYAGGHYYEHVCVLSLVYSCLGVFTFLSAYLISSKYHFYMSQDTKSFWKKRFIRVWPLFAVSSILLYAIGFNHFFPTLKGLVGISPFWAPEPTTMWYVAMLLSLYLLTPFILQGGLKSQCVRVLVTMSIMGVLQLAFNSVVPKTFNYFTVYFTGLLLGRNWDKKVMKFFMSKKTLVLTALWIILMTACYISCNVFIKSLAGVVGLISIINLCALLSMKIGTNSIIGKIIKLLSYTSFCTYLFHREVIWVLLRLLSLKHGWPLFLEVLLVGVPFSFFFCL